MGIAILRYVVRRITCVFLSFGLLARVAAGDEIFVPNGGSIQQALDIAVPGDVVSVAAGTYAESLTTARSGTQGSPITVRSSDGARVLVTSSGRVLDVVHAYYVFDGLTFDGQYGESDTLRVRDGADGLILRDVEVRRSARDCIDMASPHDVLIEQSLIHHCLFWNGRRVDAHGITGNAVRNLTIRDTEIHTFSGDAVQFDPGREAPGWDDVMIEGCRFWLAPLATTTNGFAAGTVPGENAIDTKTWNNAPRATLTIRDTVAYGFRDSISNMAAFNLKENIDVLVDGVTVFDSEIAFRLRGPTASRPAGAWVRIENAVIYGVDKAFRYEDDIENLRVYHVTTGNDVDQIFQAAAAPRSVLDVRNILVLGTTLPAAAAAAASEPSNLAVAASSFRDTSTHDYRLEPMSPARDTGVSIGGITRDRVGVPRPQGSAADVGAFEYIETGPGSVPAPANFQAH